MEKIKVLIADDIEETRNVIKKILNLEGSSFDVVGEAGNGQDVLKMIPETKPDVVLMDINMPVLNGLEATERIVNEFPSCIVIIMSVQSESEYLKKAMFYGAKEYVIKPFNYDMLIATIKTTYEKNKERQERQKTGNERSADARIIAFFSSKGGVGKSVLALNSSIVLSREFSKKVLLVDMDLQFGDISVMINQFNQKTILDAVDDGQLDTYESIRPYLYKYSESLDILFAPGKPEASEYISKDMVGKILKSCQTKYDTIIVDTGVNFSDNTLLLLDQASVIMYVSTMEIVSLKNTKLGFRVMNSLGYGKDKVKLVINRYYPKYGVSKTDVESVFKDEIFDMVPEDEKVVAISVNKGQPFCNEYKYRKTPIGKAIKSLCERLIG